MAIKNDALYLVAASGGYGFRCLGADLLSRGKAGKAFMTLSEGELPVIFALAPQGEIACVTKDGRALVFNIDEIRQLPKGRGLKLIVAGKLKGERLEICRGNRGGKGKPMKAPRK